MEISYSENKSTYSEVYAHLQAMDKDFAIPLSKRVDVKEYARKLAENAERIEAWHDNTLIGLVAYYNNFENKIFYVSNVSVMLKYSNQGIASSLLKILKVKIQDNKYSIRLECYKSQLQFYINSGFCLFRDQGEGQYMMSFN